MVTTQNGLLYLDGVPLSVRQADELARQYRFVYAEQLVRALEKDPHYLDSPEAQSGFEGVANPL